MLQPNGPLPPEIYWRRRALAIGVALVVLVLLVWIVTSIGGGGESPEAGTASSSGEMTVPAAGSTTAVDTGEPGSSGGGSGSEPGSTNSPGTPAAQTVPGQCPDQSLAIKINVERPNYTAGEEPKFSIVITNISTQACERDLAPGFQQALVYTLDGQIRLWSSSDCYPGAEPQLKKLEPGKQEIYEVTWSGTTSAPECAGERVPVAPGAYTAVGQLGTLRSTPEPFNIG